MGSEMRVVAGVIMVGLLAMAPAEARDRRAADPAANAYAQAEPVRRAPTRLRVTPQRLPPSAYRRCVDWYDTEFRPSGAVIVPKQRCWWVRG